MDNSHRKDPGNARSQWSERKRRIVRLGRYTDRSYPRKEIHRSSKTGGARLNHTPSPSIRFYGPVPITLYSHYSVNTKGLYVSNQVHLSYKVSITLDFM